MAPETENTQQRGLQGGMKAVTRLEGKGDPKIGIEEFMSIAERFGISGPARGKIKELLLDDGLDTGEGPFLANYYSGLEETKVQAYERTAREIFGSRYAIGISSGTGALHAAFVAVGVGPGTEVICPAIGFAATAMAVVQANGVPVFCDVDSSLAIDPTKIEGCITERTVAIAPTHVMGSVCDMDGIMKVARKHGLAVVEDCAQSCGGTFNGQFVGRIGDMGAFSISAYKTVGGGEGGLLLTDQERYWERANQLAESGGLWRPDRFAAPRYDGELFGGTNYRLSELEAAVDVVQLGKMTAMAARFRSVKRKILDRLGTFSEIVPQKLNDAEGEVGYLLRFYPENVELGERIVQALKEKGIAAGTRGGGGKPDWHIYSYMYPVTKKRGSTNVNCPFECPVYLARGGDASYSRGDCPVADDLFDRMVSVNLNQWYSDDECAYIADGMNAVLSTYCSENSAATPWV